jgi:mono/diheme cytochrome c family protein
MPRWTPALALALALAAVPARAADDGARVWAERCSGCHGDDGKGDGPAAMALVPRPRNFRDAAFWQGRTAEQIRSVVAKGKPGTMMQPFAGVLTDAEIDAVVLHVVRFDPARAK